VETLVGALVTSGLAERSTSPRPWRRISPSDDLGRTVLWAGVQTLYAPRERPDEDIRKVVVESWM
jgi:hypothetical protein